MREFEALTQVGQVRRMRRLAECALPALGIDPTTCRIASLQHAENTTFRIDMNGTGARYCLRIHRPDYQTTDALRSELVLLEALHEALGPVASRPVRLNVCTVQAEGVPGARRVTLLHWVYGCVLPRRPTVAVVRHHGAFMARLHRFAEGFAAPQGFVRPRLDGERVFGRIVEESLAEVAPFLGSGEDAAIRRAVTHVAAVRARLGHEPAVFGLIHADLHRRNVLAGPGWDLRAIDFDDCGWGHYLTDIGNATESLARHGPVMEPLLAAFLEGYRSERVLDDEHAALLPVFYFDRTWTALRWMAARQDNPFVRGITTEHAAICVRAAQELVAPHDDAG
jgi:Ser/Thr protein kinase RdoA (MazF antagonist)